MWRCSVCMSIYGVCVTVQHCQKHRPTIRMPFSHVANPLRRANLIAVNDVTEAQALAVRLVLHNISFMVELYLAM